MSTLLVVDLQKGFCKEKNLAKDIIKLAKCFDRVIATKFVNEDGGFYEKYLNYKCPDTDLVEGFKPDEVIEKKGYGTVIPSLAGSSQVFICGLETEGCILKTALDFWDRGIRPIILTDYIASSDDVYHKVGLFLLERLIGEKNLVSGTITKTAIKKLEAENGN